MVRTRSTTRSTATRSSCGAAVWSTRPAPAWVLAMLRHLMGDANFFLAMRAYLQQHYYGTAVTEDFQAACEQISGMNLTKFFQQWIYGEYYPQYRINSAWIPAPGGGYTVSVQIQQSQSWQIFWMPIDVRIN